MQNISLFKLSRYFFVWFLLITVLPLLSLLVWSTYNMEQGMRNRHKQLLELFAADAPHLFPQYLAAETQAISKIITNLPSNSTSLQEYKTLLNAERLFWLDSPEAQHRLTHWPPHPSATIQSDYLIEQKQLKCLFVIPLPQNTHRGLLMTQRIPLEWIMPHGPIDVELYAGNRIEPQALIFKSTPFQRETSSLAQLKTGMAQPTFSPSTAMPPPASAPPHFPMLPSNKNQALQNASAPSAPSFCPPPAPQGIPLEPPGSPFQDELNNPPKPGQQRPGTDNPSHHCANPRLHPRPLIAEKTIPLHSQAGVPIAQMRLLTFPPPHPPPWIDLSQWMGAVILLAGLGMSLLTGNYIRQTFVEPLIQLSTVAHQVQAGNPSSRIDTRTIRQMDVRQTLENMNAMLDGLNEKEQLRHSFISNLTHDFRTPLIAENRALSLLVKEFHELGLAEQEKLAHGILKNNVHLLTMVNQLLETYQGEAGLFKLQPALLTLPALVSQCFEQLSPLAEERNVTLTQAMAENLPAIVADENYLKRVFINLVGNALDNIPKGSHIEISAQLKTSEQPGEQPSMVEIQVRDNGPGIPPEEQACLFDRYHAGTGDTRKLGSGLGLYICKVLISAHQGSITVDSKVGAYTAFIIHLPIAPHQNEEEEAA